MLLVQQTIRTERLILRPFSLVDAPDVIRLASDKRVYESTLLIPHPYGEGTAESWISTHQAVFYEQGGAIFAICLTNGPLIGAISLNRAGRFNRAELGYWIGSEYWNCGYCTEAVKAVLSYGFNDLGYHKISARHFVGNLASGRVMQKAGMVREGVLRDEVVKDGRYIAVEVYGILRISDNGNSAGVDGRLGPANLSK
jgi:[ribosomal protein S5]-alanine N-acetyltransferase